ncbi:hypothetical protein GCM10029992_64520 [Glycomyces albus]
MRTKPLTRGAAGARWSAAVRTAAVGACAALLATACLDGGGGGTASGRTEIRWFVGMGAGSDAPTIPAQEQIVEEFNASQDEIELVLEIVDADQAPDILSTQIATGDAPDIVGPMGIRGRSTFPGAWLDLTPTSRRTTTTCPISTRPWSTSTRSRRKARSVCRSPSSPPSCTSTSTCSTRPDCPTRHRNTAPPTSTPTEPSAPGTSRP